jgi:hypothetical protein
MRGLTTTVDIAADPEAVWSVLTDFAAYPAWNPFVREISGDQTVGARLRVVLELPGRKPMTIRPRITRWEPGRVFEWLGHTGIRGVFDGRHRFTVDGLDDGTKFEQAERFSGLLAAPLLRFIGAATRQGFEAMNLALRNRAEEQPIPPGP